MIGIGLFLTATFDVFRQFSILVIVLGDILPNQRLKLRLSLADKLEQDLRKVVSRWVQRESLTWHISVSAFSSVFLFLRLHFVRWPKQVERIPLHRSQLDSSSERWTQSKPYEWWTSRSLSLSLSYLIWSRCSTGLWSSRRDRSGDRTWRQRWSMQGGERSRTSVSRFFTYAEVNFS